MQAQSSKLTSLLDNKGKKGMSFRFMYKTLNGKSDVFFGLPIIMLLYFQKSRDFGGK
jgi:hypothetical protein